MNINYWAIIVCGILSIVMGSVWYGPIFGKLWMRLCGVDVNMPAEEMKRKQQEAMPLYVIQLALSLFQLFVLVHLTGFTVKSGILSALWVWGGFVLPTTAGACMWNADSNKMKLQRFLVQAGFQLVSFIVFGAILGGWHS